MKYSISLKHGRPFFVSDDNFVVELIEIDREVLAEDVQGTMAAAVPTMSTRKSTLVDAMATPSITAEELMKRHMLHLGSLYPQ